jgi:phospholipase/lecithinase/hemolysin
MLSHDGIHPGAKGHTHLAELVTSRLQSLDWLSPSPT